MKAITILLLFFFVSTSLFAQDSTWRRGYTFGVYGQLDLRNSSINAISTHRMLSDAFRKGIKPKMKEKAGNVAYGFYSFAATYLTMVWSHEFGHSLRAKQVGGNFKIHNVGLPIPYTTMHLPTDINLVDEALSVTGGFEVNHLSIQRIQEQFIQQNGIYNEDLGYAFANRLMYPIYTSLIVPIDPKDTTVWVNTAGDPVHYILPVFKNFSNNAVFMADRSVNPDLVKFYNQSALFAAFFGLLDPNFYREFGASFGDMDKVRRPLFLLGDHQTGWTYGTLFNVSPLGYELYLNNYLHIKGQQFSFYGKYGNPFRNNGLGIRWFNAIQTANLKLSTRLDYWSQDIFGQGMSGEVEAHYAIGNKVDLNLNLGYKSRGYVLGKQLDKGINMGLGFTYYANYK